MCQVDYTSTAVIAAVCTSDIYITSNVFRRLEVRNMKYPFKCGADASVGAENDAYWNDKSD